jgi:outer membrane protein OmpA-like peptidoglycan-associated protein
MRAIVAAASVVLPVLIAGCGSQVVPTPQLESARQAYAQAASGPAPRYASGQLANAHASLDRARQADAWEDPNQGSFARLAQSRSQHAAAHGYAVVADQQRTAATEKLAQAELDRQTQIAAAAAARAQGRALMQGLLPLMNIADTREVVNGRTQLVFTRDLNFATNQAVLRPEGKAQLDKIAEGLQSAKDTTVVVQGFTDSTGTDKINGPLSDRRASAVADYLSTRGVPRGEIESNGYGADHPVATNDSAPGRARNRRAVVVINLVGAGATNMQGQDCGGSGSQQEPQPTQQPMQQP